VKPAAVPPLTQTGERLVCLCRAGFENECAQETIALAQARGITGTARAGVAYVEFEPSAPPSTAAWTELGDWRRHVFARQCLPAFAHLDGLPRGDRLGAILAALQARGERFSDAWVEAPDSDDGKALAPFCRSFGNALIGGLKKAHLLDPSAPHRLHALFPQGDEAYLCSVDPAAAAPWPQGIPRLKFPHAAPSRSTLKLEEALLVLLDDRERERWLKPGMSAVDLGAAPGGWTWQLVRRSLRVIAIDNGPMDRALLDSGLVTHRREDGFRYRPNKPVDWLVCDMVEQPRRIAELRARWLAEGWCRRAIFNLKLPMKKRYDETMLCIDLLRRRSGANVEIRAKQLYHDREEITVYCAAGNDARRGASRDAAGKVGRRR
jgi:23S rRNA (cytidine2498-2'-O)-methyltransferase